MNRQGQPPSNALQNGELTISTQVIRDVVYTPRYVNHPSYNHIYNPAFAETKITDLHLAGCGSKNLLIIKYWRVHTVYEGEQNKFLQSLSSGVKKWLHAAGLHSNIVCPISRTLQTVHNPDMSPKAISLCIPYYPNGNALKYLQENVGVSALKILAQVASAVNFLHGQTPPIIHGRVHVGNILISDKGDALLSDVGVYEAYISSQPFWMEAPELFEPGALENCASDVYSFAMTSLDLLTKRHPWCAYKRRPGPLVGEMLHGLRPGRPLRDRCLNIDCRDRPESSQLCQHESVNGVAPELSDSVWDIIIKCWDHNSTQRPTMDVVAQSLAGMLSS